MAPDTDQNDAVIAAEAIVREERDRLMTATPSDPTARAVRRVKAALHSELDWDAERALRRDLAQAQRELAALYPGALADISIDNAEEHLTVEDRQRSDTLLDEIAETINLIAAKGTTR